MEWIEEYLSWNRLRLFPMASFPFEKGEISFLEQGLINRLYQSKGHQGIRIDLSTSLIPILLGLRAGMDGDYVRYINEKETILKESDLPHPIIICTADAGLGDILYHGLSQEGVLALRWQESDLSLHFLKEDTKKKKLMKGYEDSFKKIHLIRENLEGLDEKKGKIQEVERSIEDLVEQAKVATQELKEMNQAQERLKVELQEEQTSIQELEKELKRTGFWTRLLSGNERLDKERNIREQVAKLRLSQKEREQLLLTFEEKEQAISKDLGEMEIVEKNLRKELSTLKAEYKAMDRKNIQFVPRLQWEESYKKDLPLMSEALILERENLYYLSQKMKGLLYLESSLDQKIKDISFVSVIILNQDRLEDFVKDYPRHSIERIYLYGGNQISLEEHWEALGHFKEWISFGFEQRKDVPRNVHRFIEKEKGYISYLKGEGNPHYPRLVQKETLLFVDKKKDRKNFFEGRFTSLDNGLFIQEVESKSQREGLWLQPSHSKVVQGFLQSMMDEVGVHFFKEEYPLMILVPNEEVKEALIRDIRRSLFSHRAIREIRQWMILEEGLSGERLDILKQWSYVHILTAKEAADLDLYDRQILWVMGGSFDQKIEEDVYDALLLRTLLYSGAVGIVYEKEFYEEGDILERLDCLVD